MPQDVNVLSGLTCLTFLPSSRYIKGVTSYLYSIAFEYLKNRSFSLSMYFLRDARSFESIPDSIPETVPISRTGFLRVPPVSAPLPDAAEPALSEDPDESSASASACPSSSSRIAPMVVSIMLTMLKLVSYICTGYSARVSSSIFLM